MLAGPLAEGELYQLLDYYCAACHSRPQGGLAAVDGFWDIDSVERMIAIGKITPGDGEGSRLVLRVRSGEMPPLPSQEPRMPDATLDRIAEFIEALPSAPPAEPAESAE